MAEGHTKYVPMDENSDFPTPTDSFPPPTDAVVPPPYSSQPAGFPVMAQPSSYPAPGPPGGAYPMPVIGYGGSNSQQVSNNTTTIINQQPQPMNHGPRIWSSGICDCCQDMGTCCFGIFCGCCQATQIATDMGESCCVPCCVPGWPIVLRAKLRAHHNIIGSVMDDCCIACCCGPCMMCQMAREIKFLRQTGQLIIPNSGRM